MWGVYWPLKKFQKLKVGLKRSNKLANVDYMHYHHGAKHATTKYNKETTTPTVSTETNDFNTLFL